MISQLPISKFRISEEVQTALSLGQPIVALESTVITHGLPFPQNIELAMAMEEVIRSEAVTPATISVIDGIVQVGTDSHDIERLSKATNLHKLSSRDVGPAIVYRWSGGTTVAGTMLLAALAGIRVFATGGIGGVHRSFSQQTGISPDVSADLPQLASTQMIVVCAGAKAILDIPATLEFLETWGVLVIGYRSDYFPAFYSHSSGLKTPIRANSVEEIVQVARAHWGLGRQTAILVANPLPAEDSLGYEEVETAIQQALQEAEQNGMLGPAVTPFLLQRVSEITDGESLMTNLALLLNNARLAAEIAVAWATPTG